MIFRTQRAEPERAKELPFPLAWPCAKKISNLHRRPGMLVEQSLFALLSELLPEPHNASHTPVDQNDTPKLKCLSKCLCKDSGHRVKMPLKKKILLKLLSQILSILRKHERPVVVPVPYCRAQNYGVGFAVWQILKYLKHMLYNEAMAQSCSRTPRLCNAPAGPL